MACMCGDTHCWSCGPAQGNTKCEFCSQWADDGCVNEIACKAALTVLHSRKDAEWFDREWDEYTTVAWKAATIAYNKTGGNLALLQPPHQKRLRGKRALPWAWSDGNGNVHFRY